MSVVTTVGEDIFQNVACVSSVPDNRQQILCFWTLSIVFALSKNRPVYFLKHNVPETGSNLRKVMF
jgi:hypothetical protein